MKKLLWISIAVLGVMISGLIAYGPSPFAVATDMWNDSSLTVARRIVEVVGDDTIFCDSSTFYIKEGNLIVITKSGDSLVFNVDSIPWDWLKQEVKDSIEARARAACGDTATQLRSEMPDTTLRVWNDSVSIVRAQMIDSTLRVWNDSIPIVRAEIIDSILRVWNDSIPIVRAEIVDSVLRVWNDSASILRAEMPDSTLRVLNDTLPVIRAEMTDTTLRVLNDTLPLFVRQSGDTIRVDTLNTDSFRITQSSTASIAIEQRSGKAATVAFGKTTDTEASSLTITDGGANKPAKFSLLSEDGNGNYSWIDENHIVRWSASAYSDPDADGYRTIDADNGSTFSTVLHSIYTNTTDTTTGELKIEQNGTGDAFVNMLLTSDQNYNLRIDNSDNNNFKIALNDGPEAQNDTTAIEIVDSTGVKGVLNFPLQIDYRAYGSDSLTIDSSTTTYVKVTLDNVNWYTNCIPDSTANYRVTVQEAGKYQVNGRVGININTDTPLLTTAIYVDGSVVAYGASVSEGTGAFVELASTVSDLISLTPGQYVELWARVTGRNNAQFKTTPGSAKTYLSLVKVK